MLEALWILRKDARRWRWLLAAFWMLTAALTAFDMALPLHLEWARSQTLVGAAATAAMLGLLYGAARDERVLGTRAYWMTRPIGWRAVLGAKLLFLGAGLVLPIVVGNLAALACWGAPPDVAWHTLRYNFATGAFILALAAVTGSAVEFALGLAAAALIPMAIVPVIQTMLIPI